VCEGSNPSGGAISKTDGGAATFPTGSLPRTVGELSANRDVDRRPARLRNFRTRDVWSRAAGGRTVVSSRTEMSAEEAQMADRLDDGTDLEQDEGTIGRRDVLKRSAVGAAAAGIVWAAPTITGLSVRPDYAAAASPGTCQGTFGANADVPHGTPDSTTTSDSKTAACGTRAHTTAASGRPAPISDPPA